MDELELKKISFAMGEEKQVLILPTIYERCSICERDNSKYNYLAKFMTNNGEYGLIYTCNKCNSTRCLDKVVLKEK